MLTLGRLELIFDLVNVEKGGLDTKTVNSAFDCAVNMRHTLWSFYRVFEQCALYITIKSYLCQRAQNSISELNEFDPIDVGTSMLATILQNYINSITSNEYIKCVQDYCQSTRECDASHLEKIAIRTQQHLLLSLCEQNGSYCVSPESPIGFITGNEDIDSPLKLNYKINISI